jgi:hypothetical protein
MATAVFGIDYETAQRALQIATLVCAVCAGSVVAAVVAYDLFGPLLRAFSRLWRRSRVECVAAAAVLGFVVAWGGSKGTISFPRTNAEYELLKDAGSFILTAGETNEVVTTGYTNDLVAAIFTTHPLVPDTADVQMWRRQVASTNDADWALVGSTTVDQTFLGNATVFSTTFPAYTATNWDWVVFTTWQPAPAVQTNGVLHVNWAASPEEQGADALRATPKLSASEVDGVRLWPFAGEPLPEVPTPDYYVQDGLVAMWDGKWNAGRDVHDADATTWVDLVGGVALKSRGNSRTSGYYTIPSWGDTYLWLRQLSDQISCDNLTNASPAFASVAWLEVVWQVENEQSYNCLFTFNNGTGKGGVNCAGIRQYNGDWRCVSFGNSNFICYRPYGRRWSESFANAATSAYVNGAFTAGVSGGWDVSYAIPNRLQIGNNGWKCIGRVYSVRLYSRALTEAEVLRNYAVDLKRFGADGERHDD